MRIWALILIKSSTMGLQTFHPGYILSLRASIVIDHDPIRFRIQLFTLMRIRIRILKERRGGAKCDQRGHVRGFLSTLFLGIDSASLCSLAGRHENPIPTWFLAPKDCSKILALYSWIPGCGHALTLEGTGRRPAAVACMAADELTTFGKLSLYGTSGHYKTHSAEKVMCRVHECRELSPCAPWKLSYRKCRPVIIKKGSRAQGNIFL